MKSVPRHRGILTSSRFGRKPVHFLQPAKYKVYLMLNQDLTAYPPKTRFKAILLKVTVTSKRS